MHQYKCSWTKEKSEAELWLFPNTKRGKAIKSELVTRAPVSTLHGRGTHWIHDTRIGFLSVMFAVHIRISSTHTPTLPTLPSQPLFSSTHLSRPHPSTPILHITDQPHPHPHSTHPSPPTHPHLTHQPHPLIHTSPPPLPSPPPYPHRPSSPSLRPRGISQFSNLQSWDTTRLWPNEQRLRQRAPVKHTP